MVWIRSSRFEECGCANSSYNSQAEATPQRKERASLGLCVFQESCHLEAGAAWSFHWLGTCPESCLELRVKSTTGEGTKKYRDPKHWNSDLNTGSLSLPFLSTQEVHKVLWLRWRCSSRP